MVSMHAYMRERKRKTDRKEDREPKSTVSLNEYLTIVSKSFIS